MKNSGQPVNYKALSWTVGAHILLMILFGLWKFSTPAAAAPVVEMGMEVNLGTSADGSGTDQLMDTEDPAAEVAANSRATAAPEAASERDVEQTDEPDAPEVAPIKPTSLTTRPVQQTPKPVVRNNRPTPQPSPQATPVAQPQKPRFVYHGSNGKGGNSAAENSPGTSEGNTTGTGDRGVPHGTPGAQNYTGSPGPGTGGMSHSLGGRNIVDKPNEDAVFREGGKVVVRVTVNRQGMIVNKNVVSSSSAELRSLALRRLDKVKFNQSNDAPAEQFGNITFVFKTRN